MSKFISPVAAALAKVAEDIKKIDNSVSPQSYAVQIERIIDDFESVTSSSISENASILVNYDQD